MERLEGTHSRGECANFDGVLVRGQRAEAHHERCGVQERGRYRRDRCDVIGKVQPLRRTSRVSREAVCSTVSDAWDMEHAELVAQGFLLQVPQAGVRDVL